MNERIFATYSLEGYTVYSTHPDPYNPEELHHGGNHPMESTTIINPNDRDALSLKAIKKHAETTAQEIANERDAEYFGVEQTEEEESDIILSSWL